MTCLSVGISPKKRHDDHHVEFEVTSRVLASAIPLREPLLTQRHCVGRYLRRRNACAKGFASTLVFGSPLTVGPNIDTWKSAAPINGKLWRLVIHARPGDLWHFPSAQKASMTARGPALPACKGSPIESKAPKAKDFTNQRTKRNGIVGEVEQINNRK